ncbi:hypothetical protein Ancab_035741 [Ancistrocladus abbreviatus]
MGLLARDIIRLLPLLFLFFPTIISSYSDTQSLTQNQHLKDGEYLVSANNVFSLGFFPNNFTSDPERKINRCSGYDSPHLRSGYDSPYRCSGYDSPYRRLGYDSPYRYLGIWYTNSSYKRPVWVANRNKPILGRSGYLMIDNDGNLKIFHHGGSPVVLNSENLVTRKRTRGILLDTGNFELRELNSNGTDGQLLWQSFDHPTDTLLPGMKLGYDLTTGKNWSISSWLDVDLPATGSFTLGIGPNSPDQLTIMRGEKIYWKSGDWHDGQFQNLKDEYYIYTDNSFIFNVNKSYFNFSALNPSILLPLLVMEGRGSLWKGEKNVLRQVSRWTILVECSRYPSDYGEMSAGCVKRKLPKCRKNIRFNYRIGYVISNASKYFEDHIMSPIDCEDKCFYDCACVVYAPIYANGTGCELWSKLEDIRIDDGYGYKVFYVQIKTGRRRFCLKCLIIGIAVLFFIILLASIWFVVRTKLKVKVYLHQIRYLIERMLRGKGKQKTDEETLLLELATSAELRKHFSGPQRRRKFRIAGKKSHGLQFFSFETIACATNDFASSNKLGQGGFGLVYKGALPDGQEVAIKRLSTMSKQGLLEFKNELTLIAKLQHTNLVKLVGCCIEQGEKIVVYEFMANKSLDYFLFDPGRKLFLDWKKRFNIIEGIAQGLLYLHKYSRLKIIHRDLKAGNILLDEGMNPKISDFGMARIFKPNESAVNTKKVVGTLGYMPPEYAMDGNYSVKSDVFSFGVLLLEIISSRKNNSSGCSEHQLHLIGYAWELWMENRGFELIDQSLSNSLHHSEALRCIHVGLLCVQERPTDRPTMSEVVAMISNEAVQLPMPKQPAFFIGRHSVGAKQKKDYLEQRSLNDASISEMEAR